MAATTASMPFLILLTFLLSLLLRLLHDGIGVGDLREEFVCWLLLLVLSIVAKGKKRQPVDVEVAIQYQDVPSSSSMSKLRMVQLHVLPIAVATASIASRTTLAVCFLVSKIYHVLRAQTLMSSHSLV